MKLFCSFGFEDRAVIPDVLQRAQLRMMKRVGIQKKDQEKVLVLRKKMCLGSRAIRKSISNFLVIWKIYHFRLRESSKKQWTNLSI